MDAWGLGPGRVPACLAQLLRGRTLCSIVRTYSLTYSNYRKQPSACKGALYFLVVRDRSLRVFPGRAPGRRWRSGDAGNRAAGRGLAEPSGAACSLAVDGSRVS